MKKVIIWLIAAVLATIFALMVYPGPDCWRYMQHDGSHSDIPALTWQYDGDRDTGTMARMDQLVHRGGATGSHYFYLGLIAVLPWIVISVIPGILFGEWEMKLESITILAVCGGLWFWSDTIRGYGLGWWMLILDVIPAAILFFWTNEEGKAKVLFGIPAAILVGYHAIKALVWVGDGIAHRPYLMAGITAAVVVVALVCSGGKKAAA